MDFRCGRAQNQQRNQEEYQVGTQGNEPGNPVVNPRSHLFRRLPSNKMNSGYSVPFPVVMGANPYLDRENQLQDIEG